MSPPFHPEVSHAESTPNTTHDKVVIRVSHQPFLGLLSGQPTFQPLPRYDAQISPFWARLKSLC